MSWAVSIAPAPLFRLIDDLFLSFFLFFVADPDPSFFADEIFQQ
jgi:hypothetical protein